MRAHRFDHLRVDPQHRVEGHHRVLKNHRHPVALNAAQLRGRQFGQITPFEQHLPATDAPWLIDKAENRKPGDRFARTRLTDQAENTPRLHAQGHITHRWQHACAGMERSAQATHIKGWLC